MITIKDISKRSGFSVTTVSKVLNNYTDISLETRKKVLAICEEMGYVPNSSARSLKTHKSYTIGIIFEEETNLGLQHPLFSKILESFKHVVQAKGYDILFLAKSMGKGNGSYLQHSMRKQVEAIFVLCEDFNSEDMLELYSSKLPIVIIDFMVPQKTTVTSNNEAGIRQGVKFLRDLGHQKIAHIHGAGETYIGGQRKTAFEEAMRRYGLSLNEAYLVPGDFFTKEEGYRAMKKILTLPDQPTAVFCASDMLAIGAMQAIREADKQVPEDYSIIGFDGIDIGQLVTPRLTTIRQDTRKMGEISAQKILQMIENRNQSIQADVITVDTYLINGESTAVLKNGRSSG
ncbi:MAG: LacI family transcriptional regulator [Acholeplasmatales bacterium]|nr:MAG: LacI family transcriptional regulator [Acholeplasmatales bacterium]